MMSNSKEKTSFETTLFSKEQIELLQKMISHQTSSIPIPAENTIRMGSGVGENSAIQECNFWLDTFDTPILPYETELTTSIPLEPESTILPPEPESTIPPEIEPNTNSSTPACTQPSVDKELIVYSRRKRPQEEIEDCTLPEQNHESDPSPS
ncbi:hypothetical protein LWI29_031643 [Acer saccharum]|uniref:Uncharacterized protein n=1 Tax=Acer saccharum TaxID=4024 RepID=A0AA39SJ11_ACESA|nr:hypothetical protein LWI29_031643 [Acer saccharum]